MDLQQMFDKVVAHLLTQRKRAIYVDGNDPNKTPKFMYQTPDGLKDAVGCLFYPGTYHPDMEGHVIKGVTTWQQHDDNGGLKKLKEALQLNGIDVGDNHTLHMLTDLQQVHDNHEPEMWEARLRATARSWHASDHMIEAILMGRDGGFIRPRRGF